MAGTRTAPTVGGSPNKCIITISAIDASGDRSADSYVLTSVPLDADIETLVAAWQAMSQASVYQVNVQSVYYGDDNPSNANTGSRDSIKDGINLSWHNTTTLMTQATRLMAPVAATMVSDTDVPDLTGLASLLAAQATILSGYSFNSAQYTERRERKNNQKVK